MKQIKEDSSSLYPIQDNSSILSRCTDRMSKLSMIFSFDPEILGSKAYNRLLRGLLKKGIRQDQDEIQPIRPNLRPEPALNGEQPKQFDVRVLYAGKQRDRGDVLANVIAAHRMFLPT